MCILEPMACFKSKLAFSVTGKPDADLIRFGQPYQIRIYMKPMRIRKIASKAGKRVCL
jgi:hypothetical protein